MLGARLSETRAGVVAVLVGKLVDVSGAIAELDEVDVISADVVVVMEVRDDD